MSREPEQLRRGKQFHRQIQQEWVEEAAGTIVPERTVRLIGGRRGRIDILVDELGENLIAIIEVKATDWDQIKPENIRKNINRHIRQIWRYANAQVEMNDRIVSAGVIYPHMPQDPALVSLIESMCENDGIQVVWHDETIEEVRARNRMKHRSEHQEECHVLEGPGSDE